MKSLNFWTRSDLGEGMDEIREEYYKMYELSDEEVDEDSDEEADFEETENALAEKDFGELNNMTVPDNEIESFRRIDDDKINDTNRDFVEKYAQIL